MDQNLQGRRQSQITIGILLAFFLWVPCVNAQLNENCTVSVLNRVVQVKPDGTWVLPNIPANFGLVRARATCVENGITRSGQSDLFSIPTNGSVTLPHVQLGAVNQIPSSLTLSAPKTTLTTAGETVQVAVTAHFPDGSTQDVSAGNTGTNYVISNPAVATISPNGLVTTVTSGTVIVSATHEGALGLIRIQVALSGGDSDGDGIPDDIEIANGLNPSDPADGFADFDGDGLTNKQELVDLGTDFQLADTDGDGITDGEEVQPGADGFVTNPLLTDTDGDGVSDSAEIAAGSDPTDPNSRPQLVSLTISPANFVLTVNTIIGEASRQVIVTGQRVDGSTVDLTADPGTNYTSSDLNICNFGAEKGRVFAANNGACTITATNSGLSAEATVTVQTFAPTALTFVNIPGTTNNVDVSGDFAYVAAGASGLQIVNVTNRSAPILAGSLDTPGNAQDVRVIGNLAYVADGASGLQIIDVTNPSAPVSRGTLDTPGDAQDVVVNGSRAFVADGSSGLQIIDVTNPQSPALLGSVDTPGSASGVDVDLQRNLAVVADGASGIQVVNITDIAHPTIVGSVDTGSAADVAVRDGFAFVADSQSSFTAVDLSNPQTPTVRASTPPATGGLLTDVVLAGRFGFGADVFFVNGVPIIDISTPASPIPRAILNFSQFGDDNGTGIAVDSAYVYLTTDFNRLLIGQYLKIEDTAGIPPTVRIMSPVSGDTVIEETSLPITVEAEDDVAVAAVTLLVNGNVVATDTAPPYQFTFTVPIGASTLTLSAAATDFGGNTGTAENVVINVIPDPLTTVVGTVVDPDGNQAAGATVTTADGRSGVTTSDGSFSIAGVPTILGPLQVRATFTAPDRGILEGVSAAVPAVPAGITDVGQIRLSAILVSWWPGDGNANDIQDGNNGTLQGGVIFVPGMVGQAFSFNGTNGYVKVSDSSNLYLPNGFTLAGWFKLDSLPSNASYLLCKYDNKAFNLVGYEWEFRAEADGSLLIILHDASKERQPPANVHHDIGRQTDPGVISPNTYYFLAVTWDGSPSADGIDIFVNGIERDTTNFVSGAFENLDDGPDPVLIGASLLTTGSLVAAPAHLLDGDVDEVKIYNRPLTAGEIQAEFEAGQVGQ